VSFSPDHARLDKWLWCVRLCKTRALAASACRSGAVQVNGEPAKPARELRLGEIVQVRLGILTRTVRFIAAPASRVAAKLVPDYGEDQTPAAEYEQVRVASAAQILTRPRGAGRPTKRDRRLLDELPEE